MTMIGSGVTAAESAKVLKATLVAAFPKTKFSVKLSRGTGYGSVTVRWADGPTVQAVDAIARSFEGKGFDGMTDSTFYKKTAMPDGRPSALGYVMLSRQISAAFARRALLQIASYFGATEVPEVKDASFGFQFVDQNQCWALVAPQAGVEWGTAVHRAVEDRTCYQFQGVA